MQVAVLVSGGKDSALALHRVLSEGHQVKYLVSMIPLREDSWMFHYPNIWLVDHFAQAAGLPLVKRETSGIKEEEVEDLKHLLETLEVEGVVCGAIASTYQKTRVEQICRQLDMKPIMPLWQEDELRILRQLLDLNFEVLITSVSAYGFHPGWLGRRLDNETVEDLKTLNRKYGISPVGEGGEYETLVLDAPFFQYKIKIVQAKKHWKRETGYLQITEAELEPKKD